MRKKLLYLFNLFIICIFISCQKDNYEKYVFNDIVFGEVKAYTNSGEIIESQIIIEFLENFKNNDGKNIFQIESKIKIYENITTNIPFNFNDEIEFISEKKAKISSNDTIIYFDVISKDEILYFQSQDTIDTMRDIFAPDDRPYYMKPVYYFNEKLKYAPLYIDTISNYSPGGFFTYFRFKPCIYLTKTKNEIYLSYTSYIELNKIPVYIDDGSGQEIYYYNIIIDAVQNIQNEFNEEYLNKYKTEDKLRSDTIVYKTNKIIFSKK
ncbi:MAG: hypothetical protein FWH18_06695 [Marinilabiliaceae bacterium]|nr:hypothetical protein [Marinilabiliaceae bacterium]